MKCKFLSGLLNKDLRKILAKTYVWSVSQSREETYVMKESGYETNISPKDADLEENGKSKLGAQDQELSSSNEIRRKTKDNQIIRKRK